MVLFREFSAVFEITEYYTRLPRSCFVSKRHCSWNLWQVTYFKKKNNSDATDDINSDDINSDITDDINSDITDDINSDTTDDINSDTTDDINSDTTDDINSDTLLMTLTVTHYWWH